MAGRPAGRHGKERPAGRHRAAVVLAAMLVAAVPASSPVAQGAGAGALGAPAGPAGPVGPGGGDQPPAAQAVPDAAGVTSLVSLSTAGDQGNAHSGGPPPLAPAGGPVESHGGEAISADGRWVAFASSATNLVPDDTNNTTDIFLRDRATGRTIRLPYLGGVETPARYAAAEPTISADGGVVAFTIYQKGVPQNPIGVFWWSAATGTTDRGSVDDGVLFPASQPSISPDGNWLAYVRPRTVRSFTYLDIWVSDLSRGIGQRMTYDNGEPISAHNSAPSISRDGRFLAFQTDAALTQDDGNRLIDVYLLDRTTQQFTRLSRTPDLGGLDSSTPDSNGASTDPSIDDDGGVVAFGSLATNLTADPTAPGANQVYVWEAARKGLRRVSLDQGSHAKDASFNASVSADGNYVAFWSAPPYVPPPATGTVSQPAPGILLSGGPGDVFLRDLRRDLTTRISVDSNGREVSGDSLYPSVSGDGRSTAFGSTATDLVPGDANGFGDVFVRDLTPAATVTPAALDFGSKLLGQLGGPLAVTVTSTGWVPLDVTGIAIDGPQAGDFRVATTTCTNAILPQDASCQVQVTFRPSAPGARSARLRITDTSRTSPHDVPLTGSAGRLTLTVDPPIGPPGIVTVVTGTGFPPGGKVALQWDRGLTPTMDPVTVDAKGRFTAQMLVFHHDQIGPRKLIVSDVGGGTFPTTTVDFLVVLGTAQPPAVGPFRFLPPDAKPIVDRH